MPQLIILISLSVLSPSLLRSSQCPLRSQHPSTGSGRVFALTVSIYSHAHLRPPSSPLGSYRCNGILELYAWYYLA
ncbi:hypothetical protein BDY19DRAFT_939136 [Irpex rosettiformis]|uniref:Uncharacterized protein n=1 Tax=Irpex rosettiformis TaxID=378272 RepID=A0ACB8U7Z3_9APHY|nr:hypothetical protein BDY19DRAFT_939136 [Irpex rosettiformis]